MELVLTHNNMDFDSLAAQFGVTKLYPSARMILGFPLTGNVRDFLALYRSSLPISQIKYVDLTKVSKVFIVDCQHFDRLDEHAKQLVAGRQRVPFTIFDHHDLDPEGLGAKAQPDSMIESVGAATTLLVDQIRIKKIPLTPFEATVLALGIYEDTGCLTYRGTTERDATCVAHLLKCGADLSVVNDFIHAKLNQEQLQLLQDLMKEAVVCKIHGAKLILAKAHRDRYIDGLASLTRKLAEVESADAAFTVVHMRDRVHIVGRSDSREVDVRSIVREFGGDGHPGAGSAVVRGGKPATILSAIEKLANLCIQPQKTAAEIMSTPVRTVLPGVSMDEAGRLMIRHGLDGLLVAENNNVIGVVSRRDIDQAMHHKLGHAPVLGFMSKPVISITPETPLTEIQHLMVVEDIGRLPVIDLSGNLVGVVSRHNVLKTLYGANAREIIGQAHVDWRLRHSISQFADKLETIDKSTLWLSQHVGKVAAELHMVAYAVGGFVRDLILGTPTFDLDYVVEGSAIELAQHMQQKFPDKLEIAVTHERFQTATLKYSNGRERSVDFSTARTEFYEYPAALPTVEPSKLDQDLMRRDFTINALAVCLNPERYGELIDDFGGLEDIDRKLIRVLHPFSFIEDPTRIIRAARFAARLGFKLDTETAAQAKHAISIGIFDDLGGTRMREELRLILESPKRLKALELLSELGARLRYLDRELEYSGETSNAIHRAERLLSAYKLQEEWVVYLGLILSPLPFQRVQAVLDRLHMTNEHKDIIIGGLKVRDELPNIFEKLKKKDHGLSNSEIYHLLDEKADESLAITACLAKPGSPVRRIIKHYLEKLRKIKIDLMGKDLVALGYKQGPGIGVMLSKLLDLKLDGEIKTRGDELKYVKEHLAHENSPMKF